MTLLAKWLKRASSLFTEKPDVKVDDFGLEHFLVYHGLVGSSPDNQRQFKDVRADISSAVNRTNSHNLCINLKLAPLWWEDKLQRIFTELKESSSERTINSLLPPKSDDYDVQDYDPLRHQDWRVRANAALVLAHLQISQGEAGIIKALDATADNTTPAFCHISRALATFRTEEAKQALAKHLDNQEPWIKVDTVNALSRWPISDVGPLLAQAFKYYHPFIDYSAVALSRQHQPLALLQQSDEQLKDLGAALVVGLLDAAQNTFSSAPEILSDAQLPLCLPDLSKALNDHPNALRMRALHQLSQWLGSNYGVLKNELPDYPERIEIDKGLALCDSSEMRERVKAEIESSILAMRNESSSKSGPTPSLSALRHGIKLTGEINLPLNELLASVLEADAAHPYRNEIIEAIGLLGKPESAAQLIKLANKLVNVQSRTEMPQSASPVLESNLEAANSYWYVLKALGHLPCADSLKLLLHACSDYASDKREEALSSAINLCSVGAEKLAVSSELKATINRSLNDPSTQVRLQALRGVAALDLAELIPAVSRSINAQEISIARASFETLESLVQAGHKTEVSAALNETKKSTSSAVKIKKIDDFLSQNCSGI